MPVGLYIELFLLQKVSRWIGVGSSQIRISEAREAKSSSRDGLENDRGTIGGIPDGLGSTRVAAGNRCGGDAAVS